MDKNNNVIVTRLDSENRKQWDELIDFFQNDPVLRTKVKSRNQMMNYIISTFLLLYVNSTEKNYMDREAELLGNNSSSGSDEIVNILNNIDRKLRFVDDNALKNNYMLLGIFNRSSVSLNDGGSIYAPGTPNYKLSKELDKIIADDIHSNQVRQQKFNR